MKQLTFGTPLAGDWKVLACGPAGDGGSGWVMVIKVRASVTFAVGTPFQDAEGIWRFSFAHSTDFRDDFDRAFEYFCEHSGYKPADA